MQLRQFIHTFEPIINSQSKILILGSVPSVASVTQGFYYMHPQNRFWRLLAALTGKDFVSQRFEGKKALLLQSKIALYDAVVKCEIIGSSDLKVKNAQPADIKKLIENTDVKKVFCNGSLSYKTTLKNNPALSGIIIPLPSTSPANAVFTLDMLIESWKIILNEL